MSHEGWHRFCSTGNSLPHARRGQVHRGVSAERSESHFATRDIIAMGVGREPVLDDPGCEDTLYDRDWRTLAGIELVCIIVAVLVVGICCGRLSAKWLPIDLEQQHQKQQRQE